MLSVFVERLFLAYNALRGMHSSLVYDSEPYYFEFSPLIRLVPRHLNSANFKEIVSLIMSNSDREAAGAVAALLSAVYQEDGQLSQAKLLAEVSLGSNPLNLFPQRTLLALEENLNNETGALAQYLQNSFCNRPFEHFETAVGGDVYLCCPSWLPRPIGNLNDGDWESLWRSDAALEIRDSIIDGSFKYCSPRFCNPIAERRLPGRATISEEQITEYVENDPRELVFSHDMSCNLSCPSCRKEKISVGKSGQADYEKLREKTLMPLMDICQSVGITGSGDPFGSVHFRRIIRDYCASHDGPRKIDLYTNAVLLDEKAWSLLRLSGNVRHITVSIDAAREETYTIVRRGGDFGRLLRNLEFLGLLRKQGEYDFLNLAFVVQKTNYKEMAAFVQMGKKYTADKVSFWNIRNWGTYTTEEFMEQAVAHDGHVEHNELLTTLKDSIFDDPICSLNDLSVFRNKSKIPSVEKIG